MQTQIGNHAVRVLSNAHKYTQQLFSNPQKETRRRGKKASEQTHWREASSRKMRVSRPLETLDLLHNLPWVSFLISKNNTIEVQQDRANQILSVSILGSYSEPTRDTPAHKLWIKTRAAWREGCTTTRFFYATLNIYKNKGKGIKTWRMCVCKGEEYSKSSSLFP